MPIIIGIFYLRDKQCVYCRCFNISYMNHTSASFKTRARTIDHLGREQIADCPTAISELWKNSYDAYSKSVTLHIMDGKIPVACIVDDGHGMDMG